MNRLAKFFIERSFLVNLITGFICISGLLISLNMNRDLIPQFEFQMIMVTVSVPGASPQEVEEFIAYPIEESLKGFPGMEKMTSRSQNGQFSLRMYFEASYSRLPEALEKIKSQLSSLRARLPDAIRNITTVQARQDSIKLLNVALKHFSDENVEHRQIIKRFEKEIRKIEGIVLVNPEIRPRDLYIEFDSKKLADYDLSVVEMRTLISQAFKMTPLGQLSDDETTLSFEIERSARTPEELKLLPISGNRRGNVITLGEIARISYKLTALAELYHFKGVRSLYVRIKKDMNKDTINLKKIVEKRIEKFNKTLPKPLSIEIAFDLSQFISKQLSVLKNNGLFGMIVVFLILIIFLNWRTALMTVLGLPIAYLGTMMLLSYLGITINLISIIGLILVLGILVDDAIIVSERYVENLEKGMIPKTAALEAVKDLIIPVTGTVLTTIVAFSPILFIKSELSVILEAVPIVIISALALSWFESFFILPNHLAHFVPKVKKTNGGLFAKVKKRYRGILEWTLRWRYFVLVSVLIVFGFSVYIAQTKLKHNFRLNVNSEKVVIFPLLKKSDSLEETYKKIKKIEDFALTFPKSEVARVSSWVGSIWRDGRMLNGNRYAKINLIIPEDASYPTKIKKEIVERLKKELPSFETDEFESIEFSEKREGDDEKKNKIVSIRVKGGGDVEFKAVEDAIAKNGLKVKGVLEHVEDKERYQTAWRFRPNLKALIQYGFKPAEFSRQIKGLFIRDELVETRINGEKIYVYTKILAERGLEFNGLSKFKMVSKNGRRVSLKQLGSWQEVKSLTKVSHYNGERSLVVDFKFDEEKTNSTEVKKDIDAALTSAGVYKKFPTYNIEVIDANEDEEKNRAWAVRIGIVCLISVFMVLAIILGSLTQPFLVAMPISFGIIGIIWALYIHDLPIGIMALIGLVGTIGVAVNDSLIMVDLINKLSKAAGKISKETILEGAANRLRAIILTTVTTVGGVIPMAYAIGGESGFTQPLAFSIAWGLMFSTVLTLFVLPSLLVVALDIKKSAKYVVIRMNFWRTKS